MIADERLARNQDGQVVLTLKTPYRDGTTHIVMSPLEFMQRLAALVPRPRLNLIRFHGVLAPNAVGGCINPRKSGAVLSFRRKETQRALLCPLFCIVMKYTDPSERRISFVDVLGF